MNIYKYFVKRYTYYFSNTMCYETKFLWFPTKAGKKIRWLQFATVYWFWNISYGWRKIRFEDEFIGNEYE